MRIGMRKVMSLSDTTGPDAPNSIACLTAWPQAVAEVSRETPWNCLKKRTYLGQLSPSQQPYPPWNPIPSATATWAPSTNYTVNEYVLQAGYLYQCLIANTSSAYFTVDLTKGYWFQTNFFSPNYFGPQPGNAGPLYEWLYAYALPPDFVMLIELNGVGCWGGFGGSWNGGTPTTGSLYELYQNSLYCNSPFANVKYNALVTDTTQYDSLFTGALILNLATIIATTLRKDNAELSGRMRAEYKDYLMEARQKNGGESNPRRYNIVSQSRFVKSRWWSTNGS